ncbi:MAG: dihydrofolate reductase family protein [Chlorobi bacterium]|nr:dihydrofolate reductase family protein [Chlorobiota bacterium]
MRKLKLQVQMSVDGFVGRTDGGLDWMSWDEDEKRIEYVTELTDSSGTILLGRKMTDGFVSYWSNVLTKPESPEYDFAKKMIDIPKVVFTKTLDKSSWVNTTLAKGPLAEEVNKLKQQKGKDIVVYGGASFVSSLINEGLIDEYHLFINPAAIGSGLRIFGDSARNLKLKLVKSVPFGDGVVVLHYEPRK